MLKYIDPHIFPKDYLGADQKPGDFEAFWQQTLQEAAKPDVIIETMDLGIQGADCKRIRLIYEDSEIIARAVFPKSDLFPVVFSAHGYMGQVPDWSESLKFLAQNIGFVVMDVRGQSGASSSKKGYLGSTVKGHIVRGLKEGPKRLFYRDVFLDFYHLIEAVRQFPEVDHQQLMTYGASQGGAIALVGAALVPDIKRVVSIYPFLSDFGAVIEYHNQSEPYDELYRYFKFSDPMHLTEDRVRQTLAYIDIKNFAEMIQGKTLIVTGMQDDICFPLTQAAVYNQLRCQKERVIVPEYGHEPMNVQINDVVYDWLTDSNILHLKEDDNNE